MYHSVSTEHDIVHTLLYIASWRQFEIQPATLVTSLYGALLEVIKASIYRMFFPLWDRWWKACGSCSTWGGFACAESVHLSHYRDMLIVAMQLWCGNYPKEQSEIELSRMSLSRKTNESEWIFFDLVGCPYQGTPMNLRESFLPLTLSSCRQCYSDENGSGTI